MVAYERTFSTPAEAADLMTTVKSSNSLAKFAAKLPRNLAQEDLVGNCNVTVDQSSPYITVSARADDTATAHQMVNIFADHVASCASDWVSKRTREVDRQLADAQRRLKDVRKNFTDFNEALLGSDIRSLRQALAKEVADKTTAVTTVQNQITSLNSEERKAINSAATDKPALRSLQRELEQALTRYTDEHPKVKELRASIIALQKEPGVAPAKSGSSRTNSHLADINNRRNMLRDQLKKAEASSLKSREALEKFSTNEVEIARLQSEYSALGARRDDLIQSRVLIGSKGVEKWRRSDNVEFARLSEIPRLRNAALAGSGLGLCLGTASLCVAALRRRLIRSESMLEEITGLPVLASLPWLEQMTDSEREYWAVETLELLRKTTQTERRGCLILGIISSSPQEGRSTWIDLLAGAGLKSGNRVLVISQPSGCPNEQITEVADDTGEIQPASLFVPEICDSGSKAIARYSLVRDVTEMRFYKHWEKSFATWQTEENALILVELPPACTAESLLLSSSVPNVIWLSASNFAETHSTMSCVDTLKNTGCNLIGAALNMCSSSSKKSAALIALLAVFFGLSNTSGQENKTGLTPTSTNSLSATKAPTLSPWQEKLTLGPGDVFDVSLYGQPDSARSGMTIGPDGRISYLQAVDILASGLTVDELRTKLEGVLTKFHLAPRVIVVPTAFHSKKYFVLGNVNQKGVFTLDKPVTVVEAVARAKGFMVAGAQRSSFRQADLAHAFLVRRQPSGGFERERVDFDGLFNRGELQNNQLLAPDDYLYFPPLGLEEVYVLGEVRGAGILPYTKDLTVLGAIAGRGGLTPAAFKQKILVVRGSLERPETFIVNFASILRAETPDFRLQPRDIVFVSKKPWAKAEELLEAAVSDFARAAATTWIGVKMEPIFNGK